VTLYLDTSNLVKLYLDEADSADVQREVAHAHAVVTSVVAYAETRATIARRRRERLMTPAEATAVRRHLDADWPRFVVIPVSEELGRAAGHLADKHGLRGFDAIHLATFEALLSRRDDQEIRFSSADGRLVSAARSLE
jgi:predicted nucleic acid-binding protein